MNKKSFFRIILYINLLFFCLSKNAYAANVELQCSAWENVLTDMQNIFDLCKICIPLLVIGLSSYEFIKAITGKDDKNVKKAFSTLIKRLALAVVFFFLPIILELLLKMIGIENVICVR